MQTITFKESNISAYAFDDEDTLTVSSINIRCPNVIIGDMNSQNAVIHTNVTLPEDWVEGKYLFDGDNWTPNSDWTDPVLNLQENN